MRNIKNPFEYGGVVSGNAFGYREKEVTDLLRAIAYSSQVALRAFAVSEIRVPEFLLQLPRFPLYNPHIKQ